MERESADAHSVQGMATRLDHVDRLIHGWRCGAVIDHAIFGRFSGSGDQWPRYHVLRGLELTDQPLHVINVGRAFLGVARVAVAGRAACEKRTLGGMRTGVGAVWNAVPVHVE